MKLTHLGLLYVAYGGCSAFIFGGGCFSRLPRPCRAPCPALLRFKLSPLVVLLMLATATSPLPVTACGDAQRLSKSITLFRRLSLRVMEATPLASTSSKSSSPWVSCCIGVLVIGKVRGAFKPAPACPDLWVRNQLELASQSCAWNCYL